MVIRIYKTFVCVSCSRKKMTKADTSDDSIVKRINKAFIDANSGDDKDETASLMISSRINWADFLTPAPMCIALLGQLMLISTEKDFSLKMREPKDGFKYMQYPESFRASLVQVCNAGWRAFNEAHKVKTKKNAPIQVTEQTAKLIIDSKTFAKKIEWAVE